MLTPHLSASVKSLFIIGAAGVVGGAGVGADVEPMGLNIIVPGLFDDGAGVVLIDGGWLVSGALEVWEPSEENMKGPGWEGAFVAAVVPGFEKISEGQHTFGSEPS